MGIANTTERYRVQLRVANSVHEHLIYARSAEAAIEKMRQRVTRDGWNPADCGLGYAENVNDPHDTAGTNLHGDAR